MARVIKDEARKGYLDDLSEIPTLILAGGFGTRLREVLPSSPKPLARVGGVPFLELLLLQLRTQGVRKVVMCTGHLADQIEEQFRDGTGWGVKIQYSRETTPLGTAGAIKLAQRHVAESPVVLVMNGDSFLELDFWQFVDFHKERQGIASLALRRVSDSSRYGTAELGERNRIVSFREKTGSASEGMINGGVYLFGRQLFAHIPEGPASLERDVFPRLLTEGLYGMEQSGLFIDIGTPEDYRRVQQMADSLYHLAGARPSPEKAALDEPSRIS